MKTITLTQEEITQICCDIQTKETHGCPAVRITPLDENTMLKLQKLNISDAGATQALASLPKIKGTDENEYVVGVGMRVYSRFDSEVS